MYSLKKILVYPGLQWAKVSLFFNTSPVVKTKQIAAERWFLHISEKQGQEFFHQFNHCALRGGWVFIFLFSNEGILCGRVNNKYAAKRNVDFGWRALIFFSPLCQYRCILGLRKIRVGKTAREVTLFAGEMQWLHISFASNTLKNASDA